MPRSFSAGGPEASLGFSAAISWRAVKSARVTFRSWLTLLNFATSRSGESGQTRATTATIEPIAAATAPARTMRSTRLRRFGSSSGGAVARRRERYSVYSGGRALGFSSGATMGTFSYLKP